MAEVKVKTPSLPANYVSIAVLRERWLQRHNIEKQKEMKCEENRVEWEKNGGEDGAKGKEKVRSGDDDDNDDGGSVARVYDDDDDGGLINDVCGFGVTKGGDDRNGGGDRRRVAGRKGRVRVKGVVKGNGVGGEMVVRGLKGYRDRRILDGEDHWGFGKGFGVGKGDVMDGKMLEGYYGNRMFNEGVDVGGKFGGLESSGGRKGGVKYGGDRRRFGKVLEVDNRNVVDVKVLEGSIGLGKRRTNEDVEIGGKFGGLLRNCGRKGSVKYGGDHVRVGKVSRVWKGKNVVEKQNVVDMREESEVAKGNVVVEMGENSEVVKGNLVDTREEDEVVKGNVVDVREKNVVDVREKNVVDDKMLEVPKGYGYRRTNEVVDIGTKFGDLTINHEGRKVRFRYGGDRCRFQPRKEKIYVAVRKGNVVEQQIPVAVRKENEVEKPIPVAVRKENEVEKPTVVAVKQETYMEKQIPMAVRKENEVEKPIPGAVTKENEVKKQIAVAVRKENEVEKRIAVAVKRVNYMEKQISMAMIDENEVKKRNLADVKMSETSKGFGRMRGNEVIGGNVRGLSKNGWRKGSVKYGRDHGRFGARNYKREESGMMWVKKCDAGADKQAQLQTADVK